MGAGVFQTLRGALAVFCWWFFDFLHLAFSPALLYLCCVTSQSAREPVSLLWGEFLQEGILEEWVLGQRPQACPVAHPLPASGSTSCCSRGIWQAVPSSFLVLFLLGVCD